MTIHIFIGIVFSAVSVGKRIQERLEAVGMSQAELARRVGIKQPTINNLIHRNKVGSKHLHQIARELGTTPAYLAGETDDPQSDVPDGFALTSEEAHLVKIYRQLPKKDRAALMLLLERMVAGDHSNS